MERGSLFASVTDSAPRPSCLIISINSLQVLAAMVLPKGCAKKMNNLDPWKEWGVRLGVPQVQRMCNAPVSVLQLTRLA
jgi:hypothetical protein